MTKKTEGKQLLCLEPGILKGESREEAVERLIKVMESRGFIISDKKQKKGPLSGIEPRTTDTRDARHATTAIGSVFFTAAALPHPALALLLLV